MSVNSRTLGFEPKRIRGQDRTRVPPFLRAILGIPLEIKLVGASLIILALAALALFGPIRAQQGRVTDIFVVVGALIVGAIVNIALVRLALRPVNALERVARLVSEGRYAERVPASIIAD